MFSYLPHCEKVWNKDTLTIYSFHCCSALYCFVSVVSMPTFLSHFDIFLGFSFKSCLCSFYYSHSMTLFPLNPSDCGSTWPGPSTTRTRPRPPMRSSSWRKFRGSLPANGKPNVRSGSLPCSSRTPSPESGITDMPSEWLPYCHVLWNLPIFVVVF